MRLWIFYLTKYRFTLIIHKMSLVRVFVAVLVLYILPDRYYLCHCVIMFLYYALLSLHTFNRFLPDNVKVHGL